MKHINQVINHNQGWQTNPIDTNPKTSNYLASKDLGNKEHPKKTSPFLRSERQLEEQEACVGSSEAYPEGWSRWGSEEGDPGLLGDAMAAAEVAEDRHPMLALFFIGPTPSVSLTPKSFTPPALAGHVLELCPLLLQWEQRLVISSAPATLSFSSSSLSLSLSLWALMRAFNGGRVIRGDFEDLDGR